METWSIKDQHIAEFRNQVEYLTPETYLDLQKDIEREYQEGLDMVQSVYEEKLAALREFWREHGEGDLPDNMDYSKGFVMGNYVAKTVREIASGMEDEFTIRDIRDRLREINPVMYSQIHPSSISGILGRMTKESKLTVVSKGSGPIPSIYRSFWISP